MIKTVLVALGGNALVRKSEAGGFDQQVGNASQIAEVVADLVDSGTSVVVTHGNGPQVGNVMLQNDAEGAQPMPLFACGAQSQGLIGAALTLAFDSVFRRRGLETCTATMLTPVVVDDADLGEPTKPVGSFYTETEANRKDGQFREDAGRGWRRVVQSPDPVDVRCTDRIQGVLDQGDVPVAAGGGGLPVRETERGYEYVDGVIDKDLTAALLAEQLGVDRFVILTDVPKVCLDYGTPDERAVDRLDLASARAYQSDGHFERGSMYEKIEAVCQFLEGEAAADAVIASLDDVEDAVAGRAGTTFEANTEPGGRPNGSDSDVGT